MTDTPQTPNDDKLDARLRAHYTRESLGEERLKELRTLTGWRANVAAVAAIVMLPVAAVLIWLFMWSGDGAWRDQARAAANVIALNHNKQLDVEYRAESFSALAAPMHKLDFQLARPERMDRQGLRLAGARYCSVGGKIAAQLRLFDGQGRLCTLYQFRPGADYKGLEESRFQIDGVQVTVWREAGLVMGLAR